MYLQIKKEWAANTCLKFYYSFNLVEFSLFISTAQNSY